MTRSSTAGGLVVGLVLAGAVLSGAVLVPAPGTLAVLSDRASVPAVAGAGSLAVTAQVPTTDGSAPAGLVLPESGSGTVQVTTTGDLPWALRVQPVGADGTPDCDVAAQLRLSTSPAASLGMVPADPGEECSVVLVREGAGAVTGAVTVVRGGPATPEAWTGLLRVTLQQRPGGFGDVVDVPLELVGDGAGEAADDPPAVGAAVAPGSGSGNGSTAGRPGAVLPPSGDAPQPAGPPTSAGSGTTGAASSSPSSSSSSASPGTSDEAATSSGSPSSTAAPAPVDVPTSGGGSDEQPADQGSTAPGPSTEG